MADRDKKGQFYKGMKGAHTTHGMSNTRLHSIWSNMLDRCKNPKNIGWNKYGGKGIQVCENWRKFENFRNDMFPSYVVHANEHGEKNTSIDRIDVNGNYEPLNCRWATPIQQARNTTQNRFITYEGRTQTIGAWNEELGFRPGILSGRLSKGWSVEKAFTKKGLKKYEWKGKSQSLADWSRELNITYGVLWDRVVSKKWTLDRAFTKEPTNKKHD